MRILFALFALFALFVIAIAAAGWNHFDTRPMGAHGTTAPHDPVQVERAGLPFFSVKDYRITSAAEFSLEARVLGAEKYGTGREADLSPVDLALGWGRMSDSAVLKQLKISQGNRFYFYRWANQPPIPREEIVAHSANMHMIPANAEVKKRLDRVREGQVVALRGYLVRVHAADGWRWHSSMTREDSGAGACELVWVEAITVR